MQTEPALDLQCWTITYHHPDGFPYQIRLRAPCEREALRRAELERPDWPIMQIDRYRVAQP